MIPDIKMYLGYIFKARIYPGGSNVHPEHEAMTLPDNPGIKFNANLESENEPV
jgi:hypothetical protein